MVERRGLSPVGVVVERVPEPWVPSCDLCGIPDKRMLQFQSRLWSSGSQVTPMKLTICSPCGGDIQAAYIEDRKQGGD